MRIARFVVAALLAAIAASSHAQYLKRGFVFPSQPRSAVLVMCPDLFVGTVNARGEEVLDPEWTRSAYLNLRDELAIGPISRVVDLRFADCDPTQSTPLLEEARSTVNLRNSDLMFRVPPGTFPLPDNDLRHVRGLRGNFSYDIGADLSARLRSAYGEADYALFFTIHDAYATPGNTTGRVLGTLIGIPLVRPPHYANALLADLRDGSIIWTHMDGAIGGDLRVREGTPRRVTQMIRRFPGTN